MLPRKPVLLVSMLLLPLMASGCGSLNGSTARKAAAPSTMVIERYRDVTKQAPIAMKDLPPLPEIPKDFEVNAAARWDYLALSKNDQLSCRAQYDALWKFYQPAAPGQASSPSS